MKLYTLFITLFLLAACSEDKPLGEIPVIGLDYTLPQGESPDDDRIMELHEKYGSYFLYEFTLRDFEWTQINDNTLRGTYEYTPADPQYVGEMLDLLNDIWFQFYPEEFLKETIPYRVFLVSTLDWLAFGDPIQQFGRTGENQIALSLCCDTLVKMSNATKLEYKNWLHGQLWYQWPTNGTVEIPEEFYEVSDYSEFTSMDTPETRNEARERGFVVDNYDYAWWTYADWNTGMLSKDSDCSAFIGRMVTQTEAEWAEDLTYPLVKQKYDILRDWFQEQYGFDIQAIGNVTY